MIAKMKSFGATRDDLIKVWTTILRPCAEYASPLWHPGITKNESQDIEDLQKSALSMILGISYIDHKRYFKVDNNLESYEDALKSLNLESLHQRREELTTNFAKNLWKSKHRNLLPEEKQTTITRNRLIIPDNPSEPEREIIELKQRTGTSRYNNSAIPYMTRIINGMKISRPKQD